MLNEAVDQLASTPGVAIVGRSRWLETAPVGGPAGQAAYLNGAVVLETSLGPAAVFERLCEIERNLGRVRERRWDARTVDLDLLLYDQFEIATPRLTVPHPRMTFRRFVLEPAAEVAAEMVHATSGWSVGRLLAYLDESSPYVAIAGVPHVMRTRLADAAAEDVGARFLADPASDLRPVGLTDRGALEVERLARRGRLLAQIEWPVDEAWTVSDFWLGESLAWLAAWPDEAGRAAAAEAWRLLRPTVPAPRLLVVLEGPHEETARDLAEHGLGDWDAARRDQWRAALVEETRRSDQGPVLWLSTADEELGRTELLAAIGAMG
jgi:2-amino-4-hydroxy-6-hydroxymethyldihydropteridine diphosphokinase